MSTFTCDSEPRPVFLDPAAICGQNKANAADSDFLDFFILSWSIRLTFMSILVSTMCGKHLLTEATNSSGVPGRGPINLL
jgi:hypothetical protein